MIAKLTNAVFNDDKSAVLSEIHMKSFVEKLYRELGASNPIAAFVSVTTKYQSYWLIRFDPETVKRVIQLLEHIRDTRIKEIEDAEP